MSIIHRLLKYGCPAIAKKWAIQGRLPLSLLHDPTIPYSKFKKAYRDAKLLFEYQVKVLAQCFCQKCVNFELKFHVCFDYYDIVDKRLSLCLSVCLSVCRCYDQTCKLNLD
jgi:hypothetical protein